jgi:hypothetical protein
MSQLLYSSIIESFLRKLGIKTLKVFNILLVSQGVISRNYDDSQYDVDS